LFWVCNLILLSMNLIRTTYLATSDTDTTTIHLTVNVEYGATQLHENCAVSAI